MPSQNVSIIRLSKAVPGLHHRGDSDKLEYNHCLRCTHACKAEPNLTFIPNIAHKIMQTSSGTPRCQEGCGSYAYILKDQVERKKAASVDFPASTHPGFPTPDGTTALSVDRRVASLEASVPGMIKIALADVVTPLNIIIDALASRITVLEIPDVHEMPQTTTGHRDRAEQTTDPESEAETDEKMHEETEGTAYEDLTESEVIIIDVAVQASLAPITRSSGAGPSGVTPGIKA
uniref:Polyprotein protein n=1 Tax=Solanum tuberosum TaxID=4113 RepID=M1DXA7_SOLTU